MLQLTDNNNDILPFVHSILKIVKKSMYVHRTSNKIVIHEYLYHSAA